MPSPPPLPPLGRFVHINDPKENLEDSTAHLCTATGIQRRARGDGFQSILVTVTPIARVEILEHWSTELPPARHLPKLTMVEVEELEHVRFLLGIRHVGDVVLFSFCE